MSSIKAILFDLDGVLVDTRDLHFQSLKLALNDHDFDLSLEEHSRGYDGLPTKQKLQKLSREKGIPEKLHQAIWELKQRHTQELIEKTFQKDSELFLILSELKKQGYQLACCSNSIRITVENMLKGKGVLDLFDLLLSNDDVESPKPHPEIYLRAFIGLGRSPKECLIVEDSPKGQEAARQSGARLMIVENRDQVSLKKIRSELQRLGSDFHEAKKWKSDTLTVVVPMAGAGSTFSQDKWHFPKPLVDINGKPMIQWVLESLNVDAKFVFIVRKELLETYHCNFLLKHLCPNSEIVVLDQPTNGALESVLSAKEHFDKDEPMVIVNSDQCLNWESRDFFYSMLVNRCDGGIVTFKGTHPKWSFAQVDEDGYVTRVAEKQVISDNATAGVYYFSQGSDFVRYAHEMIEQKDSFNNEYYVCPVYNYYIRDKKKVQAFEIEDFVSFATPNDVEQFIQKEGVQHV